MMQPEINKMTCPNCSSKQIKKHGIKKKKLQTLQRYFCKSCQKTFTLQPLSKSKTYPIAVILNSISNYSMGNTQSEIQNLISRKFKLKPSQKTISNWLNEYKTICTYARLRKQAMKLYKPKNIIFQQTLNHIQPYTFKCHKAKLDILIKENPQFTILKDYIKKINSNKRTSRTSNNSIHGKGWILKNQQSKLVFYL